VLTYFVLVLIETGPSEYVPIRCFFREMDIDYRGRAEGGAKIFEVFRVKNHDFTPKNHIFSNFRGGAGYAPPPLDPPLHSLMGGTVVVVIVCSWIYNYNVISAYHYYRCEFEPRSWWGVLDTTLGDKVCQQLTTGRWFSLGTPVSSTNQTDHHAITDSLTFTWPPWIISYIFEQKTWHNKYNQTCFKGHLYITNRCL
jgi:hypothetical protein